MEGRGNDKYIVIIAILTILSLYLLHFRFIHINSDDYAMDIFDKVASVKCEDLKIKGKGNRIYEGDYLYKWCVQQRVTEVDRDNIQKLSSTCTSNYYNVTVSHYDKWLCTTGNNQMVLKNPSTKVSITLSDSRRGLYCIQDFDDGCTVTPFVETEYASFEMYESSVNNRPGEIYSRVQSITTKKGVSHMSVKFDDGRKIGELTEVQKEEIRAILNSIDLLDQ